jgi:predicted DNA binding CopG/RHH family protein
MVSSFVEDVEERNKIKLEYEKGLEKVIQENEDAYYIKKLGYNISWDDAKKTIKVIFDDHVGLEIVNNHISYFGIPYKTIVAKLKRQKQNRITC